MYKELKYNGEVYSQFLIDENGIIRHKEKETVYSNYVGISNYVLVSLPLGKRGCVKNIRVHKAVAETFLSNPKNLPVVHHIDGDKRNCCLLNLMWVSHKQNTKYNLEEKSRLTEFYNNRKLTKDDVKNIRADVSHSYSELARIYNVSKTTILNVKNYKSYIGESSSG